MAEIASENNHFEGNLPITGINKIKIVRGNYGGNLEIYQPNKLVFDTIKKVKNKVENSNENNNDDMFEENFPFKDKNN